MAEWARNSFSTSARSGASPAHSSSRKAGHCPGACCSIAAKKIVLAWLDCSPMLIAPGRTTPLYRAMRIFLPFFSGRAKRAENRTVACSRGPGSQEFAVQPSAGVLPMPVSSCGGHAEDFAGLLHGQAREIAQLDQPCGRRIVVAQLGQGLVDRQELVRGSLGSQVNGIDVEPFA